MRGASKYECKSDFTSEKICAYYRTFANRKGISLDTSLDFFYHSQVYQLMREGVSDMHCMSDGYLADELEMEYREENRNV